MEVRKLERSEHENTRKLYEDIFREDSQAFVDYYYTEKTKDNEIYVAEEEGDIRAMLHLNPYRMCVNGSVRDTHYIVAVATQPEYRKRGFMAAMLQKSLRDMYEAKESFTFLMPASEQIYLPFDFRTVYEQEKRYYHGTDHDADQEAYEIATAKESDSGEIAAFAEEYLKEHYQVYVQRDEPYYRRLIKEYASDGGSLKLYRKNGKLVDCRIEIPGEAEAEKPKIMIRIVDVRRMLMSLGLRTLTGVCFQVSDPVIPENNRCIVLTGTEYSGVMLMEGKLENSEGTITVAALASMIFGAKTIDEVCLEEGVRMTDRMREELKKIVPLSAVYLNEVV